MGWVRGEAGASTPGGTGQHVLAGEGAVPQALVPATAPGDVLALSTVLMGLPGFLRAMD